MTTVGEIMMGLSRGEGRQVFGWMVTCARSGPRESAAALRGSGELGASGSGGLREYWCKRVVNSKEATKSVYGALIPYSWLLDNW